MQEEKGLGEICPNIGHRKGFPDVSAGKESTCNVQEARDAGLIPGSRRSSGGGHGNPLQYSCLENSMDRGAWKTAVHEVTELDGTEVTKRSTAQDTLTGYICPIAPHRLG